jgi:hypothetical protein
VTPLQNYEELDIYLNRPWEELLYAFEADDRLLFMIINRTNWADQ